MDVCGWRVAHGGGLSGGRGTTGYIGEFELVDDHRSGKIVVELTGRINKCGVISPRFDVPLKDIEKWVGNLLPSRQVRRLPRRSLAAPLLRPRHWLTHPVPCCCLAHIPPPPSFQFGLIVLTTTFGIMDHHEARRKHTGGKVLGFFY